MHVVWVFVYMCVLGSPRPRHVPRWLCLRSDVLIKKLDDDAWVYSARVILVSARANKRHDHRDRALKRGSCSHLNSETVFIYSQERISIIVTP